MAEIRRISSREAVQWTFLDFGRIFLFDLFEMGVYRVTHLFADWVGLTWIWDVPLS